MPGINPTAPSQLEKNPQIYYLAKIIKFEAYFLHEVAGREKLAKKMKCLATI